MKICVATNKGGLEDEVSPVFGRCTCFTFVEVEGEEMEGVEVVPNDFAAAPGGAGIQAAQYIANKEVKAVIAGNFGPNAYPILNQAGIEVITGQGNVKDVVLRYAKGELTPSSGPSAPEKFGGMRFGGGMGRGRMMVPQETRVMQKENKQDLQILKDEAGQLEKNLRDLKKKIDELEKNE